MGMIQRLQIAYVGTKLLKKTLVLKFPLIVLSLAPDLKEQNQPPMTLQSEEISKGGLF